MNNNNNNNNKHDYMEISTRRILMIDDNELTRTESLDYTCKHSCSERCCITASSFEIEERKWLNGHELYSSFSVTRQSFVAKEIRRAVFVSDLIFQMRDVFYADRN